MTRPVVLRAEARAEFDEAFDYDEGRRAGSGVKFVGRIQEVFDRIGMNPDMHPTVFADVRRAVVRRFPYSVDYRSDDARIEVIAVFHASRDPSVWKGRI